MKIQTECRIYVGTYGKYNNGSIGGEWVDLAGHDKESFLEKCREIHSDESDPEFMYQDFNGFPRSFYDESYVPDELFEYVNLPEDDRNLLNAYIDAVGSHCGATLEQAQDSFRGIYASGADFAEQIAEECGDVPKDFPAWIVIDWEASWNSNLRHDYITGEANGDTYFFS